MIKKGLWHELQAVRGVKIYNKISKEEYILLLKEYLEAKGKSKNYART